MNTKMKFNLCVRMEVQIFYSFDEYSSRITQGCTLDFIYSILQSLPLINTCILIFYYFYLQQDFRKRHQKAVRDQKTSKKWQKKPVKSFKKWCVYPHTKKVAFCDICEEYVKSYMYVLKSSCVCSNRNDMQSQQLL